MTERMNTFEQTYMQIIENEEFNLLEPYKDESSWEHLSRDERKLLADLFVLEGEQAINESAHLLLATEAFSRANALAPKNSGILVRQSLAFGKRSESKGHLKMACQAAELATRSDPDFADAWVAWAESLTSLGVYDEDLDLLDLARANYERAEAMLGESADPEFEWNYALCLYYVGKLSGEASDFAYSIKHYKRAKEMGVNSPLFYCDYGRALIYLHWMVSNEDLFQRGLSLFEEATKADPYSFEGWFNVACCRSQLWTVTYDEEDFHQANEAFQNATGIQPGLPEVWLKWALHLLGAGKLVSSVKFLEKAITLFEKANELEPDHALVNLQWANAEIELGALNEDIALLKSASDRIERAAEAKPEERLVWEMRANCLYEMGAYFSDERYFLQSVEIYKNAIHQIGDDARLWYGLGRTYFMLGLLRMDAASFEEAVHCYEKALALNENAPSQVWNDYGAALMRWGELVNSAEFLQQAITALERCVSGHEAGSGDIPVSAEWLFNLGSAYDMMGDFTGNSEDYEQAIRIFTQSSSSESAYPLIKLALASTYTHLGELVQDTESLIKACDLFAEIVTQNAEDDDALIEWGHTLLILGRLYEREERDAALHQSEQKLMHALALGNKEALYQLACLYAFKGEKDRSNTFLDQAKHYNVLPTDEEIEFDGWI